MKSETHARLHEVLEAMLSRVDGLAGESPFWSSPGASLYVNALSALALASATQDVATVLRLALQSNQVVAEEMRTLAAKLRRDEAADQQPPH